MPNSPLNPDTRRDQAFPEIGRFIESAAELLVDRWHTRALVEQPAAVASYRAELRNHLVKFLGALGHDLAESRQEQRTQGPLEAVRHGEQRWHIGWQLTEVVRDYQILRLVILEWLEEALPRPVSLREVMAIGQRLDEAIAAAVTMYVRYQEDNLLDSQESLKAAKNAADSANLAKGDLLTSISHELRTPMNSILGMVQLALEDRLSPAVGDYLETIKDSADLLLTLLNELLDYSRLESGRVELDPHPFNLRTVLDETLRSFAVSADEKRLELACDLPFSVPNILIGDSFRLRQVLTNLVSNAVKFTEAGEVIIRVAVASESDSSVTVEFTVADTGIGIPLAAQQSIFEPFAQAAASTSRHYGGTGLGLAICKELTFKMGGRVWVESAPGEGSRFHFTARFARAAPSAELPPDLVPDPRLKGRTALVVDDHPATRHVVEQALHGWGMFVQVAADAGAARDVLQAATASDAQVELIIADARLPVVSGFEMVEQLQTQGLLPRYAIMMFSNIDRRESTARSRGLGINGFLIKPVSCSDLLATVQDVLGLAASHEDSATPAEDSQGIRGRRRVLLAEDTPANQKLFRALLARHGCDVVVVENGKEAVESCEAESFDLVLMDLQMPVMDGLKATALIRAREKAKGGRIPIIALTAHALPRDRERCLAAGMDEYLSKPINIHSLERAIEQLAAAPRAAAGPASQAEGAPKPAPDEPLFNRRQALKRLGGNETLFSDLVRFFLEDAPELLLQMRRGLDEQNVGEVRRAAHSLRGLAANFDATSAMRAAREVEDLAFDARWSDLPAAAGALRHEVDRLCEALREFLA